MAESAQEAGVAPVVSIIVPSWNTRALLLDALRSFWPLRGLAAELLVVDNASTDGSADAVEAEYPSLKVIRNPSNLGFAGAVNTGFAAARGEFALLLNSDTLVGQSAIGSLVRYAQDHPEVGVVGPLVCNPDGTAQPSCFPFPSLAGLALEASYLYQLFPNSRWLNRSSVNPSPLAGPLDVDAVSGCCFLVRRSLLERIGPLDTAYFMYSEEVDFCLRARRAGSAVRFFPYAQIMHLGGGSSRLQALRSFLEFRRSRLRFFHKNYSPAHAQAARALLLAFLALRLPYWGWRALRARGDAQARARFEHCWAGIRFLCRPLERVLAGVDLAQAGGSPGAAPLGAPRG